MAPFYEVLMLTKSGTDAAGKLKTLLTNSAKLLWERGAVIADVTPWGHRELAYRIRAQNKNHYDAQYTSLHVHCSPNTLNSLQNDLRNNEHVLRWMTFKQRAIPPLSKEARHPMRAKPPETPVDLEANPAEAMRWEYRNLVMQRVFEGRTKQELIAEQLVRHRFQHSTQRPAPQRASGREPTGAAIREGAMEFQSIADGAPTPNPKGGAAR